MAPARALGIGIAAVIAIVMSAACAHAPKVAAEASVPDPAPTSPAHPPPGSYAKDWPVVEGGGVDPFPDLAAIKGGHDDPIPIAPEALPPDAQRPLRMHREGDAGAEESDAEDDRSAPR